MKIIIIAAVSENNVIGNKGKIPWHSKAELKHFKKTTMGYPIIMGRKTFESIGKILPGRTNAVVTRDPGKLKGFREIVTGKSIEAVLEKVKKENPEKVFIIGGGEIYDRAFDIADELLITRMPITVEGDTFFPEIKEDVWELTEKEEYDEFSVERYVRKENAGK